MGKSPVGGERTRTWTENPGSCKALATFLMEHSPLQGAQVPLNNLISAEALQDIGSKERSLRDL